MHNTYADRIMRRVVIEIHRARMDKAIFDLENLARDLPHMFQPEATDILGVDIHETLRHIKILREALNA